MNDDLAAAEKAVVGACMSNPGALRAAAAIVTPADFADTRLGQTFGLIAGMVTAGQAVDTLTVGAESARRRKSHRGGPMWHDRGELQDIAGWAWTAANVAAYAEVVAREAYRRRAATALRSGLLHVEQGQDPGAAVADTQKALREAAEGAVQSGALNMQTLGELLAVPDVYEWLIPGLFEKSDRVVFTGAEGSGKTTLCRQIAICLAAGVHPFGNHGHNGLSPERVTPIRVCVIDVENTERQWRRQTRGIAAAATHLGHRSPADHVHLVCTGRMNITSDRDLGRVHAVLDDHQPDLLYIGSLYKLVPRAITNDDDAAPLITALDSIRDRGITMLMEAHQGHAKDAAGRRMTRPRGSAAILGWPEFGFGLDPQDPEPGEARSRYVDLVRWRGDREERDWPETLVRGSLLPWETTGPTRTTGRSWGAAA